MEEQTNCQEHRLSISDNNKPDDSRETIYQSIYQPWINRGDIVIQTQENTDHEKIESIKDGAFKSPQERTKENDRNINDRRDGEDNCTAMKIKSARLNMNNNQLEANTLYTQHTSHECHFNINMDISSLDPAISSTIMFNIRTSTDH
jgi:hypothetical protein